MNKLTEAIIRFKNEEFIRAELGLDPNKSIQQIAEDYRKLAARDPIAAHMNIVCQTNKRVPYIKGPHYDK